MIRIALACLAVAGCADTIRTDYTGLLDRTAVVTFLGPADIEAVCSTAWGLERATQSCVSIARDDAEAKRMTERWVATGGRISCLIVVPENRALLEHELSLCANRARGYWHKRESAVHAD